MYLLAVILKPFIQRAIHWLTKDTRRLIWEHTITTVHRKLKNIQKLMLFLGLNGETQRKDGYGPMHSSKKINTARKAAYFVTSVNILFQILYMTLGRFTYDELGILRYVFFVFRPSYMVLSGVVSIAVIFILTIILLKSIRKIRVWDIIMLVLNLEFVLYYIILLSKQ